MAIHHSESLASYDGSWRRRIASLEGMPLDIIHLLADHSSVEDLVALSSISKTFRGLLGDRSIWKKLYRRSTLLLPPGPYEWQSTSYLINALLRGEKFHSLWPSPFESLQFPLTHCMKLGCDAKLSVLLGRWLFVAEGSTLSCYDSYCSNISPSAVTLHDAGIGQRILRVFSVGNLQEDGVLAIAVLVFKDTFTIARVLMDRGQPSDLETVFISTQFTVKGWTDLVDVQLYHRLLIVTVGECSSDWESSGRLIIMDINTLCRYHILASTNDAALFNPIHTSTSFFATKTHFMKVIWSSLASDSDVYSKVECFSIPTAPETPDNYVLYLSHQHIIPHCPKMCECTIIHESLIDSETGRISFTLCGLGRLRSGNTALKIMDVCLNPDGSVSFIESPLFAFPLKSFCIGLTRERGHGVGLDAQKRRIAFTLCYSHTPVSASITFSSFIVLDHGSICQRMPCELLAMDTFLGTAYFIRRSSDDTFVEMIDFSRGAQNAKVYPACIEYFFLDGRVEYQ